MIHTDQKRRIGIITVPKAVRTRLGRLGVIRAGWPASNYSPSIATIAQETPPDTSQSWLAQVVMRQSQNRQTDPGTLEYTPAARYPAPPVPWWNSWGTSDPSCAPASTPASSSGSQNFWIIAAVVGAAAAIIYAAEQQK